LPSNSNTIEEKLNTLRYWHVEEFLIPQEIATPKKIKEQKNSTSEIGTLDKILFEMKKVSKSSNSSYQWSFILYGAIYPVENILNVIEDILPQTKNNSFEERPPSGMAGTYALSFTPELKYVTDSFQLSTAPWAISVVSKNSGFSHLDYSAFQSALNDMDKEIGNMSEDLDYEFGDFVSKVDKLSSDRVGNLLMRAESATHYQFVAIRRKVSGGNKKEEKDSYDMLNSFYIKDLGKAIKDMEKGEINPLVLRYLEMKKPPVRIDVREKSSIEKVVYPRLRPNFIPDACWATSGGHPLVFSQQFVVNSIVQRLGAEKSGLYSVNGSAGTGKTTMLRDLIAHIITERAKVIASFDNPKEMFLPREVAWKTEDSTQYFWEVDKKMLGFEIVVASSNNGAVENVTKEIPAIESIDEEWLDKMDYFRVLGDRVLCDKSWGIGSSALGNAKNKQDFIRDFLHNKNIYETRRNSETGNEETVIKETLVGMLSLLDNVTKEGKTTSWEMAKNDFEEALQDVKKIKDRINKKLKKPSELKEKHKAHQDMLNEASLSLKDYQVRLEECLQAKGRQESIQYGNKEDSNSLHVEFKNTSIKLEQFYAELTSNKEEISDIYSMKPSWIEEFFIDVARALLGREKEFDIWSKKRHILENKKVLVEKNILDVKKTRASIRERFSLIKEKEKLCLQGIELNTGKISTIEEEIIKKKADMGRLKKLCIEAEKAYQLAQKEVELLESVNIDSDEVREKSSPWTQDKIFQKARANLFIQALNLHRATIEENSQSVRDNLSRIREILEGKVSMNRKNENAVLSAWSSLFLCVPVLSTTFASLGKLFGHLDEKKLGWLLIDEAGQGTAKACIGGMMRVRRAVVVGDPLQLEPIVGLSGKVQEAIRKEFNAPEEALSEHTSIQKRADFTEEFGTYLELDTHREWIGSPLRVHRRCSSPMFEISNTTTYKGLMIQGKPNDMSSLLPSKWVNVDSMSNNGHWISAEGEKTRTIFDYLKKEGIENREIYIISPFRDVVNGLYEVFKKENKNKNKEEKIKIGTIHTVQGQEAKVVILVLGSDPKNDGARVWASSKPNLLNVAITRAKVRIYVVGNKDNWENKKYFKDTIKILEAHQKA